MRTRLLRTLMVFAALVLVPVGTALAHGKPVIGVQPNLVAAGGQITVTGTEMEADEEFTITLESMRGSISLGEVTVTGEGEEGGFTATFTIPADTAPGSYTVRATTGQGEAAVADLTVTAPSSEASAGPATVQEATGELHQLNRTKPTDQVMGVVVLIALSSVIGFVLVRNRR